MCQPEESLLFAFKLYKENLYRIYKKVHVIINFFICFEFCCSAVLALMPDLICQSINKLSLALCTRENKLKINCIVIILIKICKILYGYLSYDECYFSITEILL